MITRCWYRYWIFKQRRVRRVLVKEIFCLKSFQGMEQKLPLFRKYVFNFIIRFFQDVLETQFQGIGMNIPRKLFKKIHDVTPKQIGVEAFV